MAAQLLRRSLQKKRESEAEGSVHAAEDAPTSKKDPPTSKENDDGNSDGHATATHVAGIHVQVPEETRAVESVAESAAEHAAVPKEDKELRAFPIRQTSALSKVFQQRLEQSNPQLGATPLPHKCSHVAY
ncbi:hypothetical protein PINS_up013805 [Pythium insidiosum]|nr:hypothetical protein PINS_up013805 [Pythium insidiosum]